MTSEPVSRTRPEADAIFAEAIDLHRQGRLEEADRLYAGVLETVPDHADAVQMRGTICLQQGRAEEAVQLLRRALRLRPEHPQTLNNLGTALIDLKRYDEAIETLRLAAELQPNSPDILGNLGRALRARRYLDQAVPVLRKAVSLAPERPGLHSALGNVLAQLERFDEAVACHEKALSLAPHRADLRNNLAQTQRQAGEMAAAEATLRDALALDPDAYHLHRVLGLTLKDLGKIPEAMAAYREAREKGANSLRMELELLFFQNHVLENDPVQTVADARRYARRRSQGVKPFTSWDNERTADRPLRIGWVSGDFGLHPVGRFLVAVLPEINPGKIEMFAYSSQHREGEITERLKQVIPHWRDVVDKSNEELAGQIHADRIDVLVDLSGYTSGNRLVAFAYRPAPVAVTWLGYFATTGYEEIDYVLCNDWLIPAEEESQWVERPWRLPNTHWCYSVPSSDVPVAPTPALGNGVVTFGTYNKFDKISRETTALWASVLHAVPDSRLLLRFSNKRPDLGQRLAERFAELGLGADRVTISDERLDYAEHMASYSRLDIALDPFPYNGGTTTAEALYMGVPVLTRRGARFVSHMGESCLRAAGLDEWVAADDADFIAKARSFAADIGALDALRQQMRAKVLASRLFDAPAFARDLETAFSGMWSEWLGRSGASGRS